MAGAPITVAEAAALGIGWKGLQTRRWRRVAHGIYVAADAPMSDDLRLRAIARRLPAEAVFSGRTAGWLHGLAIAPCDPIEATVPSESDVAHRAGLLLHKCRLRTSEVMVRRGFRVTSPDRTIRDLGAGRDQIASVTALDMALHSRLRTLDELHALAERAAGKGSARFRRAVALARCGAESPMESRLRLTLVFGGLPTPEVQVPIRDLAGVLLGRADLYYPTARLCIEYDGTSHRLSLVEDNRRQNRLVNAGYTMLRFTAADLSHPERVVALVAGFLRSDPAISREIARPRHRARSISREIAQDRASA